MKLVIVESPFACDPCEMIKYGRKCLHDSVLRGEAPIASHLLFTQPGVLDDRDRVQRSMGINAGHAWLRVAELVAVYEDFGISKGMELGIERAESAGIEVDHRLIGQDRLENYADEALSAEEWEEFEQEVRGDLATSIRLAGLRLEWTGFGTIYDMVARQIERGEL